MPSSIYSLLFSLIITLTVLVIPFTPTTSFVLGHANIQESKRGFQFELMHRDYGMKFNRYELLRRAIQRGKDRLQWFHATLTAKTNAANISAPTGAGSGENIVFYSIGGQNCSSYCGYLPNQSCGNGGKCIYLYQYGDGSSTNGTLSTETLTFGTPGSTVSMPNIVFGCGTNNQGTFAKACGLIGLGRGPLSFISQLGYLIFSYCLVPLGSTTNSTMYFGSSPTITGPNATSTLLTNPFYPTFYYIKITHITYGGIAIPIQSTDFGISNSTGAGGCILDSGTTLTYWPTRIVLRLNAVMKASLLKQKLIPIIGQSDSGLSPCWFKPSNASFKYPKMEITFNKGQTLSLSAANYMVADTYTIFFFLRFQVVCSILQPNSPGIPAIYGNIMQANYRTDYDLGQGTVQFIKTACG
ncbi:Aspartic proteinase nepenthesin-1-like protein [Drosera capensis]